MLSRPVLLVPQAPKCRNHGNEPGMGSAQGASLWPGGWGLAAPRPERRSRPPAPAPRLSGVYFLVTEIYFKNHFEKWWRAQIKEPKKVCVNRTCFRHLWVSSGAAPCGLVAGAQTRGRAARVQSSLSAPRGIRASRASVSPSGKGIRKDSPAELGEKALS